MLRTVVRQSEFRGRDAHNHPYIIHQAMAGLYSTVSPDASVTGKGV